MKCDCYAMAFPIVQYKTLGFFSNGDAKIAMGSSVIELALDAPRTVSQVNYLQVSPCHITDDDGDTVAVYQPRLHRPFVPLPGSARLATQSEFDRCCAQNPADNASFDWNARVYLKVLDLESVPIRPLEG